MKVHSRNSQILQLLRQQGHVSVDELSQRLAVSQMTVRRDLQDLEDLGLISRYYGGASLRPERGDIEWPVLLRETENAEFKRRIGRTAAALIHDGDVIIMDAGTTTLQVAQNLKQNRLTVASNFLPILNLLAGQPNVSLIALGGNLYGDNQCFIGALTVNMLHSINANVAIMAASCLSLAKGMTSRNLAEAEVKRAMIEAAETVILVMDSSKMHRHTLAQVGGLETLDVLVTDEGLSEPDREAITARGVKVITALV
jgi:DeoR/GlpR family transcriptional regulator of sugar metabolism